MIIVATLACTATHNSAWQRGGTRSGVILFYSLALCNIQPKARMIADLLINQCSHLQKISIRTFNFDLTTATEWGRLNQPRDLSLV